MLIVCMVNIRVVQITINGNALGPNAFWVKWTDSVLSLG